MTISTQVINVFEEVFTPWEQYLNVDTPITFGSPVPLLKETATQDISAGEWVYWNNGKIVKSSTPTPWLAKEDSLGGTTTIAVDEYPYVSFYPDPMPGNHLVNVISPVLHSGNRHQPSMVLGENVDGEYIQNPSIGWQTTEKVDATCFTALSAGDTYRVWLGGFDDYIISNLATVSIPGYVFISTGIAQKFYSVDDVVSIQLPKRVAAYESAAYPSTSQLPFNLEQTDISGANGVYAKEFVTDISGGNVYSLVNANTSYVYGTAGYKVDDAITAPDIKVFRTDKTSMGHQSPVLIFWVQDQKFKLKNTEDGYQNFDPSYDYFLMSSTFDISGSYGGTDYESTTGVLFNVRKYIKVKKLGIYDKNSNMRQVQTLQFALSLSNEEEEDTAARIGWREITPGFNTIIYNHHPVNNAGSILKPTICRQIANKQYIENPNPDLLDLRRKKYKNSRGESEVLSVPSIIEAKGWKENSTPISQLYVPFYNEENYKLPQSGGIACIIRNGNCRALEYVTYDNTNSTTVTSVDLVWRHLTSSAVIGASDYTQLHPFRQKLVKTSNTPGERAVVWAADDNDGGLEKLIYTLNTKSLITEETLISNFFTIFNDQLNSGCVMLKIKYSTGIEQFVGLFSGTMHGIWRRGFNCPYMLPAMSFKYWRESSALYSSRVFPKYEIETIEQTPQVSNSELPRLPWNEGEATVTSSWTGARALQVRVQNKYIDFSNDIDNMNFAQLRYSFMYAMLRCWVMKYDAALGKMVKWFNVPGYGTYKNFYTRMPVTSLPVVGSGFHFSYSTKRIGDDMLFTFDVDDTQNLYYDIILFAEMPRWSSFEITRVFNYGEGENIYHEAIVLPNNYIGMRVA